MNNTFELRKGKLVFEEDKIVITDNAKYLKKSKLFSSIFLILMGLFDLMNFIRHNDLHMRWTGLLIGVLGVMVLISTLLTNAQSEIYLKDVKSMKVKRILFREYFVIKLANNRTRQVAGIYNAERLEEYIATISLPNKLV
jgi:hypothetical protein